MYLLFLKCFYNNKNISIRKRNYYYFKRHMIIQRFEECIKTQPLLPTFYELQDMYKDIIWENFSINMKLSKEFSIEFKDEYLDKYIY